MHHKISFLLGIIVLLSFSACNYWKVNRLQTKGKVGSKQFFHELEFETRKGLVVVKTRINNSAETYEFIFDTGAYTSTISRSLAEQLELLPRASRKTGDSRGNIREMEVVLLKNIDLGGLQFQNIAAGVVDFPENSAIQCIAKDGIIGANLIRECHWKMDFQQKKMWLTDDFNRFPEIKNEVAIPFKNTKRNGKPYIEAQIEEHIVHHILIDIGSNGGIDLPAKWLKKRSDFFSNRPFAINYDSTSVGLWGRSMDTTKVALIHSFQIGPHQLTDWRVDFTQKGNAKMGMEVLSHFDVYLNYETSELFLLPQKPLDEYDLNAFGFVPDFVSPDYFIVRNIFIPSAASAAGLALGDTLTYINRQKPSDHYEGYCDYFRWAGELLRGSDSLIITKNGKEILLRKDVLLKKTP